jgi:hypothetical protein
LSEGHAIRGTAADIVSSVLSGLRIHLLAEERQEITRIEAIPNLPTPTVKPNVFQGALAKPWVNPKAKDSLVGSTKLACARQHPATIDPNRKVKGGAILQSQALRRKFRTAIKWYWRRGRVIFRDAPKRDSRWKRLISHWSIGPVNFLHFQTAQLRYGIDTTRAQQDQSGVVRLAVFENVNCSTQIVFDHLPTAALSVHTSEDAGIRCCIDHPIRARKRFHVAGASKIGVTYGDAYPLQSQSVQFAARPDKVVQTKNLHIFQSFAERDGQRVSRESTDAGDQDAHD